MASQYRSRALELHTKYGSNDHIVRHCETVARVAGALVGALKGKGVEVDEAALMMAALLHDIGRNKTQTVQHGYVGAQILESEDVSKEVAEIVRRHVGAGISAEEAAGLGFPAGDYIPRTLEQRVVCFADKMVDGDRVRPFEQEVKRFISKGHDVDRLKKLKRDLKETLGRDPEEIVLAELRG